MAAARGEAENERGGEGGVTQARLGPQESLELLVFTVTEMGSLWLRVKKDWRDRTEGGHSS